MELTDYSGPYKHDLGFEDFSKDFLIKLMKQWQRAYIRMPAIWYEEVMNRFGTEAADSCDLAVWLKVGEKIVPKFAKIGNIQLNTVLDSAKLCHLLPDVHIGSELSSAELDIKNENLVIASTTKCLVLDFFEKAAPERIEFFCHVLCPPVTEKYFSNPKIKVTPLELPPRKSPDEICCQFEIKLEA